MVWFWNSTIVSCCYFSLLYMVVAALPNYKAVKCLYKVSSLKYFIKEMKSGPISMFLCTYFCCICAYMRLWNYVLLFCIFNMIMYIQSCDLFAYHMSFMMLVLVVSCQNIQIYMPPLYWIILYIHKYKWQAGFLSISLLIVI